MESRWRLNAVQRFNCICLIGTPLFGMDNILLLLFRQQHKNASLVSEFLGGVSKVLVL